MGESSTPAGVLGAGRFFRSEKRGEDVNEVETFARAGERAGAAVGSGVRAARKRARLARKHAEHAREELARRLPEHTGTMTANARRARDTAQATLAERAGQAQEVLAEHWGPTREALAERLGVAQDVLAERLNEARHELAARIEPEQPRHRRRWPWLVLLLLGVVAAGAAILTRRPYETEPEPVAASLAREPGSRNSDPDTTAGSSAGNGVVGVERPSASAD